MKNGTFSDPLTMVINEISLQRDMGLFCSRCKSLMPPGSVKCRVCGNALNDSESKQSCLTEIRGSDDKKIVQGRELPAVVKKEDPSIPFFPYEPRAFQKDIIKDISGAMSSSKHIVIESGTGTGKTICALTGVLQHARAKNKKILYLTRTISQSDQVMNELRAISKLRPVSGITLTGRKRSCPLLRTVKGYEDISPKALSSICEERRNKSRGAGCKYYDRTKQEIMNIEAYCKRVIPSSEQLDEYCESIDVCPYEAKKALIQYMDVVVAPYVHILSDDIRSNLLVNMKCEDENIILVVDEAHNLVEAARDQESFLIKIKTLDSAISECDSIKNPIIGEDIPLKDFLAHIKAMIKSLANDKLTIMVKESRLGPSVLEQAILRKYPMTQTALKEAIEKIIDIGEDQTERMLDQGNNRISDTYNLGVALKDWILSSEDQYIKTVKADDDGEFLSAACIDPKDIIGFMRGLKGAVHMSGTLQPLEQYVRTIGLPNDTVMKTFPSPFPTENRSVIYLRDVTTKYDDMKRDPSIFTRMERTIAKLCNSVDKNTLVFFPSYSMMIKMRPFLERDVSKRIYWEESRKQKQTMNSLDQFRKGRNGVFFTVMGGSIAEGIDFPGDELCFAIIVGIPYPPPTLEQKAMSDMFDQKYGQGIGWKYMSEVPALRKIKQAIGRLIRTETDRGMAVIMDSRISKYEKQLNAVPSADPVGDAVRFFEQ